MRQPPYPTCAPPIRPSAKRGATFPPTPTRSPLPPPNLRAPLLRYHAHRLGNYPNPMTPAFQTLPSSCCIENAPAREIRSLLKRGSAGAFPIQL
jgi:hypothetical protein